MSAVFVVKARVDNAIKARLDNVNESQFRIRITGASNQCCQSCGSGSLVPMVIKLQQSNRVLQEAWGDHPYIVAGGATTGKTVER